MPIPAELTAAIASDAKARAIFGKFPPSHQREYARWVSEAKQPATREARALKAVAQMKQKAFARR